MKKDDRIIVTGSEGLLGSSIIRELKSQKYKSIFKINRNICDLENKVPKNSANIGPAPIISPEKITSEPPEKFVTVPPASSIIIFPAATFFKEFTNISHEANIQT